MTRRIMLQTRRRQGSPKPPDMDGLALVAPGEWVVNLTTSLSGACIDVGAKRAVLPFPYIEGATAVRRHEKAHARWSPKVNPAKGTGLDPFAVNAFEDCRVEAALDAVGLGLQVSDRELEAVRQLAAMPGVPTRTKALALVCIGGRVWDEDDRMSTVRELLTAGLSGYQRDMLFHLIGRCRDDGTIAGRHRRSNNTRRTNKLLRTCARQFEDLFLADPERKKATKTKEGTEKRPSPYDEMVERQLDRMRSMRGHSSSRPLLEWGKMVVKDVPLTRKVRALIRGLRRAPTDMGIALKHPHRAILDGTAFERKIPVAGATMLIDASGSMSFSDADIYKLVEMAPASTVAMYSGSSRRGELCIIARNGRMADQESMRPFGSGNIVDGPALAWLLKQPPPRLWVSDGHVTGLGDSPSDTLLAEAIHLCDRGRVLRLDGIQELQDFVARETKSLPR